MTSRCCCRCAIAGSHPAVDYKRVKVDVGPVLTLCPEFQPVAIRKIITAP